MRSLLLLAGLVLTGALLFTVFGVAAAPAPAAGRETLQDRLKRLPDDHRGWARLGVQYVDQARISGDPSYYAKAEGALDKAARLSPRDDAVLTGQATLAAGRHEFAEAERLAERALDVNAYSAAAYGVLADARVQLGDLRGAREAVERMLDLRPGVASFARASYAAELRGDLDGARRYLQYAHEDARVPADLAYARHQLGELALHAHDFATADRWYARALEADPGYTPALAGRARAAALDGRLDEALTRYEGVVRRLPLPQYLIEQGEVRLKAGLPADWTLLDAQRDLLARTGVRDDLTWAEFEADHGDPGEAVRHARAEYARNPGLIAADALGWALFKADRPREALRYAKQATSTGWRHPVLRYHRAEIERSLGRDVPLDPRFDPELATLARFS